MTSGGTVVDRFSSTAGFTNGGGDTVPAAPSTVTDHAPAMSSYWTCRCAYRVPARAPILKKIVPATAPGPMMICPFAPRVSDIPPVTLSRLNASTSLFSWASSAA